MILERITTRLGMCPYVYKCSPSREHMKNCLYFKDCNKYVQYLNGEIGEFTVIVK